MKKRLCCLLLSALLTLPLITGCRAGKTLESAGEAVEQGVESISNTIKEAIQTTPTVSAEKTATPTLTAEEAQSIALKHAGFTADQVKGLHTEYEIDQGVPQYDVEFRSGNWEYDYEIHANTGEILSYSKDD